MPTHVFIDANFLISTGRSADHPIYQQLRDWVSAGLISVVTTSHTKQEVVKKFAHDDANAVKDIARSHFRLLVKQTVGIELPEISKEAIEEHFWASRTEGVGALLSSLNAVEVEVDDIPASAVLTDYAQGKGFFAGSSKKDQFPDAFIFKALTAKLEKSGSLIILSNDGDFVEPCSGVDEITLVQNIGALANTLGIADADFDSADFLTFHEDQMLEMIGNEMQSWGLNAYDVQDAYIDEDVEPTDIDIDLASLKTLGKFVATDEVLVMGRAIVTVLVTYEHPNWDSASYDSEDKVLIPWEDVSGEKELDVPVDFTLLVTLDEDGHPVELGNLRFTNEFDNWIELYPYESYK